MPKIEWTKNLCIGVVEIDDQHRKLVDLVNRLVDLKTRPTDRADVISALRVMCDYLDEHFTAEELLMIDRDYPELEEHRHQHQDYVNQTEAFVTAFKAGREHLTGDILVFLQKWLVDHILEADRRFGIFLNDTRHD